MSVPRKHHFVPKFYLASWCGSDRKLSLYQRINDRIEVQKTNPRSTAFEPELYSLQNAPVEIKQIIETGCMQPVDDKAAKALRIIKKGKQATLSISQRADWARFILSLRVRIPEKVDYLSEYVPSEHRRMLSLDSDEYEGLRSENDPASFVDWIERNFPGFIDNLGRLMIPKLIDNPEIVNMITAMDWWTADFSDASVDLLTCDRPCVFTHDLKNENCLIILPLSPTLAFFASGNSVKLREKLIGIGASQLARMINESIVSQAVKYVYARSSSHQLFVERRLRNTS